MNQMNLSKETFWSRFANDFEKRNNYVAGRKEIESLKNRLSENKNLGKTLELGCGDGAYTETIAANAKSVVATDWSDDMIKVTMKRFINIATIEVKRENCFDLSFNDNSFDTVFMANLLHVIPTPEKALEECKRVLKPNGTLIILSFTIHGMKFFHKLGMLYRYLKTYGKPPKESSVLTVPVVTNMLAGVGFVTEQVDLMGSKMKSIYAVAKNR
jgi:ubiquinone/menaquinone biosynthesis C-methylase UbiE